MRCRIINYKSFAQTIRAISKWKTPLVIDLEKYWKPKTCQKQFPHFPLILIDPTDPNRNVAAALSAEQLERIIRASKSFLKKPSLSFFFPAPTKPWNPTKIRQKGKQQKIIGIALGYPAKTISDIVWAQLNRLTKKMKIFFDQFDFEIKRIQAFTNEKNSIVVLATLKENRLPSIQKRIGPFAGDTENVKRFLKKHRITHYKTQKGHVMLETKRKIRSAKDCLKLFLKESAITTRPPLQKAFQKKKLLTSENLGKETKKNKGLRIFATEFLKKETRF
ncbi:hypothetical protein KJ972_02605 [Candidatus Micrarchaeota archaeon]|nr:hypothetical protein [Candidatus Micrarchaeota archaeon]